MYLSKSDYMLFLKHPAWVWLKKHEPHKLPEIDEATQAVFDNGYLFESYAEQLFNNVTKIEREDDDFNSSFVKTKEAIDGGAEIISQGGFKTDKLLCFCDILKRVGENEFDLYEIKSATDVRPEYLPDLAFQKEVLEQNGYKINKFFVIHVNNNYVRNGEVKADEICKIQEVTEKVNAASSSTKVNIHEALKVIDSKACPDITPANAKSGCIYEWLAIYKELAELEEYSIYHLCSPNAEKIAKLETLGIKKIHEIPDSFDLNDKQRRQYTATKSDEVFADKLRIKSFLNSLEYPLYFLDYETLAGLVPYFDGHSPYMQVPFQYSLHVLESPDGELKHYEYLHSDNSDPIKPLSDALKSQIGEKGTVLVWYEPFEKSCNKLMGKLAPEYKEFYSDVNKRIVDLMVPFSDGAYVHKDFFGSASIKKVLPVLCPDLSHKDLDISEGQTAQRLWMEVILEGKHENEKQKILSDLLKYCELDTFAMVRIYQFLKNLV